MKRIAIGLLAAFLLLSPMVSTAAEQSSEGQPSQAAPQFKDRGAGYLPYAEPSPLGTGGMLGAIARTIFALAVVLGLLYLALWGLKKLSASAAVTSSAGPVQVVGRVYLNPKTVIYFVRLVDELLVIGTTTGNISLLAAIKENSQIEQIEHSLRSAQPYASGKLFSRFFDTSLLRFQKVLEKEDRPFEDQIQALDDRIGRLKGLSRRRRSREKE